MTGVKKWFGRHKKAVIAAAIIVGLLVYRTTRPVDAYAGYERISVGRHDITTYNSFVGNVRASTDRDVLSKVSDEVMAVYVENGDTVREGDIIAVLDTGNAEYNIAIKEASLAATQTGNYYNIRDAQRTYDDYKTALDSGLNQSIQSAQNQKENAYVTLQDAKNDLANAEEDIANGKNTATASYKTQLDSAAEALENAQTTYNNALGAYNSAQKNAGTAQTQVSQAQAAYDSALAAWNKATSELAKLKSEALALEQQINELQTQIDAVEAQIQAAQAAGDTDEVNRLTAEKTDLETKKGNLTAEKTTKDAAVNTKESETASAKSVTDTAEQALNAAKANNAYTALTSAEAQLSAAAEALQSAGRTYNSAADSYNRAKENAIETLADSVESAERSYRQAAANYDATALSAQQQLATYLANIQKTYANANTETSRLELENLKDTLEKYTIVAPCDGTVTALNASVGQNVAAGTAVATISDLDTMEIDIRVDEYSVLKTKTGADVIIYMDASGKTYDGTITWIAATATVSNGVSYFEATVSFAVDEDVRGGMSAEVRLINVDEKNVIAVPADALYYHEDNTAYVYVEGTENAPEERAVVIGASDGTYVQVTEGLDEDDRILITRTDDGLAMGPRVEISDEE